MRRFWRVIVGLILFALPLASCGVGGAEKHYILAERLWSDGKYGPAVEEFDRAARKDPKGKIGLKALFRAGMTQTLFLDGHADAIQKLRAYVGQADEPETAWVAQKQIGQIYFEKLREYAAAIEHYEALLTQRPEAPDAPEFRYLVGRSQFFLWRFPAALQTFERVVSTYPGSPWAEAAAFQVGVTHYTSGEQRPEVQGSGIESYKKAITAYQDFLSRYPSSRFAAEAKFGIAECLEELDQLDEAYQAYAALKDSYPSPKVIDIKLIRLKQRQSDQNRSANP